MMADANEMMADAAAPRFNVEAYTLAAAGPWQDTRAAVVLRPDLVHALRYVQRRFGGTADWLAHVLVTPTHKEARITAFLSTWAYEQHWLAKALGSLVGDALTDPPPATRLAGRFHVGPLVESVLANARGSVLTGAQMCEQLVNGWVLDAMLARIQSRAPQSAVATLEHVRQTLGRQLLFFEEMARLELAASPRTQRFARRRLRQTRFPLGSARESWADTSLVFTDLFGASRQWAVDIDARVATLPGLAEVRLFKR